MRFYLFIRGTEVPDRSLQGVTRRECDPRAERRLAINAEDVCAVPTLGEAHDDLGWCVHLLETHLPDIRQRIS